MHRATHRVNKVLGAIRAHACVQDQAAMRHERVDAAEGEAVDAGS